MLNKLSEDLHRNLCHEDLWKSGGITPPFLNWALDRREWSVHAPAALLPGEIVAVTRLTGEWIGPTAGRDAVQKRKESGNRTPAVQPVARRYTDSDNRGDTERNT
jgi:hypothetical protein